MQYSTSFVENNNNIQFSALPKSLPELKYFTQEDMNALEVFLSGENIDASKFVNPSNGKDSSSYISAVIEAICRNQLATVKISSDVSKLFSKQIAFSISCIFENLFLIFF